MKNLNQILEQQDIKDYCTDIDNGIIQGEDLGIELDLELLDELEGDSWGY